MEAHGHETTTIDKDAALLPDYTVDVLTVDTRLVGIVDRAVDILWASPPCEGFSVTVIGRNWNRDHTPKTDSARLGESILRKTLDMIEAIQPKWWFIENPRGKMRRMPYMFDPEESKENLHSIMGG